MNTPTLLSAVPVSVSSITPIWDYTNAGDEVGFKLNYSTDNINWSVITLAQKQLNRGYWHTGLAAATKYYYKLCAYDVNNNNSPFSNVVSGTTPSYTLSANNTSIMFLLNGTLVSGYIATVNVVATAGLSWTASRGSNTWMTINGGATKSGTGNGSFIVACPSSPSSHEGSITITSNAPTKTINVQQTNDVSDCVAVACFVCLQNFNIFETDEDQTTCPYCGAPLTIRSTLLAPIIGTSFSGFKNNPVLAAGTKGGFAIGGFGTA
jgi:hypothetical protein